MSISREYNQEFSLTPQLFGRTQTINIIPSWGNVKWFNHKP